MDYVALLGNPDLEVKPRDGFQLGSRQFRITREEREAALKDGEARLKVLTAQVKLIKERL